MNNFILDNNIFILCTIVLISGLYIFKNLSNNIETPNSPRTFNFTKNQLIEIEDQAENMVNSNFIQASENCYPKIYPITCENDPIEKVEFVTRFIKRDWFETEKVDFLIDNLVEKTDRLHIYSPLENNINLDFLNWMILFFISILLIRKYWREKFVDSLLIPFSVFDIDFRDAFNWTLKPLKVYPKISYLKIQSLTKDLKNILNNLDKNENFSMGISYIPSYRKWKENGKIPIYLQDAIIVNKESDPILITQFIMETLINKELIIRNRIFDDDFINLIDPVILIVLVGIEVEI